MKKPIGLLLQILFVIPLFSQINLDSEDWRSDLRFLQKTIHADYPFLFKKTTSEDFDKEVESLFDKIPELEEHEIIVGLARIVSSFEYGHTSISLSGWREREEFNFNQLPFNLKDFKDGVYIQGVHQDFQDALGAKVLKLNGQDIEEVLSAVKPVFPTENEYFFRAYGLNYAGMPEILHAQGITDELTMSITLTLEKNGKVFDQVFTPIRTKSFPGQYGHIVEKNDWLDSREKGNDPYYLKNLDRIYYYEYLPEHKTVYIRHSQIQDDPEEDIPSFYQRVFEFIDTSDVEKLVLDVRLNGGGNNYKNKPIVTGIIKQERINQAGKFFVITSGRTFSACQNLVNELDNYTEAIFVGQPTGENINFYGDNNRLILPNSKIPVRLSFAWWQDKPQWENGPWTTPHFKADMTFEEFKSNQDPVLDIALDFEAENFILNPMNYLTNLYQAGEAEKLQMEAARIVNDPNYSFFDFESEFNDLGYKLINQGHGEIAVQVFQMVVGLFPNSANAWDSLGEGFWKIGQIEKAIENYNKAIELDPDGEIGANARKMLEKIQSEQR